MKCATIKSSKIKNSILVACLLAGLSPTSHAVEGGMGVYLLGFIAPQAGLLPPPADYFTYNLYTYQGDASAQVSVPVPVPGSGFKVNGDVKAKVNIKPAHIFSLMHVFEEPVLGGNAALGMTLPFASADLKVTGSGTLIDPDNNSTLPLSGKIKKDESGIGDAILTGALGWHDEMLHYMTILNVYLPTGDYDENRLVNIGKNHTAIEPIFAMTYLNTVSGLELSGKVGITFNQENHDTNYKSGHELHLDFAAIQHLPHNFSVGLAGYAYKQISDDDQDGADKDFRGRVYALGPVLGAAIPVSEKTMIYLNARYYNEFSAKNRLEGEAFYLTASVPF